MYIQLHIIIILIILKVKFKIEAFVCVGGHEEETRLVKTFESKEFEIPRKDPLIYIARSEVDFGAGSGSETEYNAFEVENHGADPLSWSATDDKDWIEFSPPHGGSGEYVDVTVNRNDIAQEDLDKVIQSGTISFSGNGGNEFVTVKAAIVAPSTPQNLTITNAGSYNQSPHLTWDAVDLGCC